MALLKLEDLADVLAIPNRELLAITDKDFRARVALGANAAALTRRKTVKTIVAAWMTSGAIGCARKLMFSI